jgi:hypothetical protein
LGAINDNNNEDETNEDEIFNIFVNKLKSESNTNDNMQEGGNSNPVMNLATGLATNAATGLATNAATSLATGLATGAAANALPITATSLATGAATDALPGALPIAVPIATRFAPGSGLGSNAAQNVVPIATDTNLSQEQFLKILDILKIYFEKDLTSNTVSNILFSEIFIPKINEVLNKNTEKIETILNEKTLKFINNFFDESMSNKKTTLKNILILNFIIENKLKIKEIIKSKIQSNESNESIKEKANQIIEEILNFFENETIGKTLTYGGRKPRKTRKTRKPKKPRKTRKTRKPRKHRKTRKNQI